MKNKLIWICPEFTPYHEVLFDALDSDSNIELEVNVIMDSTETHPFISNNQRKYEWHVSKNPNKIDWPLIKKLLSQKDLSIVISSYLKPTLVIAIVILGLLGIKFVYFTDTPLPNEITWSGNRKVKRPIYKRMIRSQWLKWIFKHAIKVLATGQPGVDAVIDLGCPTEKAVVFPYWVDLPPAKLPKNKYDSYNFLCVGQIIERKNFKTAIEAFSKLVVKKRIKNIKLIIIGSGQQEDELRRFADKFNIRYGKVIFKGWLKNSEIHEELSNGFAFIHPAKWEPFGVSVLEAMAHSLPILASDQTMAALDRVKNGYSGFIHQTGNVDQLSAQMELLISKRLLTKKMRKKSRMTAEKWRPSVGVKIIKDIFRIGNERV